MGLKVIEYRSDHLAIRIVTPRGQCNISGLSQARPYDLAIDVWKCSPGSESD